MERIEMFAYIKMEMGRDRRLLYTMGEEDQDNVRIRTILNPKFRIRSNKPRLTQETVEIVVYLAPIFLKIHSHSVVDRLRKSISIHRNRKCVVMRDKEVKLIKIYSKLERRKSLRLL